jgi:hypothetical protein
MKLKLLSIFLILYFLLIGCNKEDAKYLLEFNEISYLKIEKLDSDNIDRMIEEKIIDEEHSAFIYTGYENSEYEGGINYKGQSYYLGQVSMENTPEGMMGIEETQVFGKKAVKIYGILGANYAQAYYWFPGEKPDESIIQVDGNTGEIDLDRDDKNEIISTSGTIPGTKIYMLKEGKIHVCNINESIGAKSVILKDKDKKLFEVYFEPDKPQKFIYYEDFFIKR